MQVDFFPLSLLLIILLLLSFVVKKIGMPIIAPGRLFIIPWLLSTILIISNIIHFDDVFSFRTFISLSFALIAFVVGAILSKSFFHNRKVHIEIEELHIGQLSSFTILFFSIVYIILSGEDTISSFINGKIHLNLNELRQDHWEEHENSDVSVLGVIKSIGRSTTLLLAIFYIIIYDSLKYKYVKIIALIALSFLMLETLMEAGRSLIVYSIFCMFYIRILMKFRKNIKRKYISKRQKIIIGLSSVIGIYLLLGVFPFMRNSKISMDLNKWLAFKHEARISDKILSLPDKSKVFSGVPYLVYGSSYFSLPIVKYNFFVEEGEVHKWYRSGGFNFSIVSKLMGTKEALKETRNQIAILSSKEKYNPNPWATALRDFVIDFGLLGGIFLFFAIGIIFQAVFEYAVRTKHIEVIMLIALCALSTMLLPYSSPFRITYTGQTMYFIISLIFLKKITNKFIR
jgi:hypothetical protein